METQLRFMNEANYPYLHGEQKGNELHRRSRVNGGERVTLMEMTLADQCVTLDRPEDGIS